MSKKKVVCTSGYFNPLHKGHLELFKKAKLLGDRLVVIVNNDKQVRLKKSAPFMNEEERLEIVRSIKYVWDAWLSVDNNRTVCETLKKIQPDIFAKGGDSTKKNTPEMKLCKKLGIKVIFEVGGDKIQSSSWLKK